MSKIKNENFIVIHGWMINELELKGNELLAYAFIYGITQEIENQYFTGSQEYISNWLNCTRRSVVNTIKSLEQKELIEKEEVITKRGKFLQYRVCKSFTTPVKKVHNPCEKSSHNNIVNKIDYNNIIEWYNNLISGYNIKSINKLNQVKKDNIKKILKDYSLEEWKQLVEKAVNNIDYIQNGRAYPDGKVWKASFDYFTTLSKLNIIEDYEIKDIPVKQNTISQDEELERARKLEELKAKRLKEKQNDSI